METDSLLQSTDSDNDPDTEKERRPRLFQKTYEEALAATGYGKFHYRLLALCGWSVSSDAIEILSISFILPPATCDMNLSDSDKGWINSSVFIGMMIGSYFWGVLADLHGRRAVLMWSLAVNALGGLLSSFAQVKWLFILMRLISGIGVGGSMPVIFTYFTEFQSKDKRGAMISVLATFWMCGNILAAGLAVAIIPRSGLDLSTPHFTYSSWRLYLAICILPSATSALLYVLMPESPKYLLQKGKDLASLQVLQRIFRANKGHSAGAYEVESLILQEPDGEVNLYATDSDLVAKTKHRMKHFWTNTVQLFKPPLTSITIVMSIIYFTLSFGYYGLFMWFPELFARVEETGGSVCTNEDVNSSHVTNNTLKCDVPKSIYIESFLTAISNLPGNIITIFIIDRIGRKIPLVVSMLVSGVSVFFIYFLHSKTQMVLMSCLFSGISVIGWNALDVLLPELYPTELRSTSSGLLLSIGRIAAILGNQVFGQLVSVNCAIPMLMVVAFLGIGGLSAIKLPNMTKKDLL